MTLKYQQVDKDYTYWKAEAIRYEQLAEERYKQHEEALTLLKTSHMAEISRLNQQRETDKASYDKSMNEYKDYHETQRHQWIVEKDQLLTRIHNLEKQLQKHELAEQVSKEQYDSLAKQLDEKNSTINAIRNENHSLNHMNNELQVSLKLFQTETDTLRQQLADKSQLYQTEHDQLLSTQEKLAKTNQILLSTQELLFKYKYYNKNKQEENSVLP